MTTVLGRGQRLFVFGLLALLALLGIDIVDDLGHGGDVTHIATEALAFLTSFGLFSFVVFQWISEVRAERDLIAGEAGRLQLERNAWREQASNALKGLAAEIDRQFNVWNLSYSEKEIALLILKGLAHKEIAEIRNTSERTVRQQAAAVYCKAGLQGKHQLFAFFLEDLMLPGVTSSIENVSFESRVSK